jgi:DNA-binding transcriptional LysR family regulator
LSIELTSTLVGSGGFVGLLPRSVVQSSSKRAGLKSLPVRFEDPHIAVGIVTIRNRTLSPLAQRFIDCAKEVTSSIPKPRLA